jgi:hypothetical protein
MEEIEIKKIKVDSYSYLKGIRYGFMASRDIVESFEDKRKLSEAIIIISKQIKDIEKNRGDKENV